jgi:hypothetical protein
MQKNFKASLVTKGLMAAAIFAFTPPKHNLAGKWIIMHADGSASMGNM